MSAWRNIGVLTFDAYVAVPRLPWVPMAEGMKKKNYIDNDYFFILSYVVQTTRHLNIQVYPHYNITRILEQFFSLQFKNQAYTSWVPSLKVSTQLFHNGNSWLRLCQE